MAKKDREQDGWTPEELEQLAEVAAPIPPATATVAALDEALDAFRAHYAKASPRFRKEAVEYLYSGIGPIEL
jgi:hypothetical protein